MRLFFAKKMNVLTCIYWKSETKNHIFVERKLTMNIQTRKLELIEQFLHISDETLIAKLESFLKNEKQSSDNQQPTPMSMEEFHAIIDSAKNEAETGKVISHQDLKKSLKAWQ